MTEQEAVDFDVVVIGAGIAGLVSARECARKGLRVVVIDEAETPGGFVATHEVGGIRLDSGAESFAVRGGEKGKPGPVAALIADLGLGDDIVTPNPRGAWVQLPDGAAPLPKLSLLGIPGAPLADDVRRILGWKGALRAQLDRYIPLLRVRPETDLGGIVRRRMGKAVLDRLVTPIVAGVHSASPTVIDVHAVAPGLTKAMTSQGSLSGAVLALLEERGTKVKAGSAVGGIDGGMFRLVEALVVDCEKFGVEFRMSTAVRGTGPLTESTGGRWVTTTAAVDDESDPVEITSRAVVVATSFRTGLALLGGLGIDTGAPEAWPEPASVELATLVVDDARLDAAPRGTGVLVATGVPGIQAKALTHATAKWNWLAEAAGPGRHVLRLSYDLDGVAPPPTQAQAMSDASALLGVTLDASSVRGFDLTRWNDSLAFATVGHRARVEALRSQADAVPGLLVVGAWMAGTGLAATVAQSRTAASDFAYELRTAAL
ncbi:oxygen-dependent protoporphyrinogen oxidase [Agreia bicolorata]|uniref:Oxygen-dependent protoporphyrinogen oxidase n=1 Tax=Agreia bicolorata TaxID=110935 RepID=A0A1T4YL93_9MICO|nr:FAD-dependent oxidoreductase [Agreia bicolorata]SKB02526.1 oxygen-dependent protoporphyrinogen oxidase [Agreia bicolorata]